MNLSFDTPVRFQLAQTPGLRQTSPGRPRVIARAQRGWMALLILLGFGWRMIGLIVQGLTPVEEETIQLSTRPLDEAFTVLVAPEQSGAFYYLLMRPWLEFFGATPFSLRYASVLFSVVGFALMWQVARRMVPTVGSSVLRNLPLLSTIFLVANPYQLWYSQEGGVFVLVVVLVLFSSWSWLQAMWYGGLWRWVGYLLVTAVSLYTHLSTVLLLPVHLAWFLLANPLNRQRWKGYGTALVGFALPLLPLTEWGWRFLAGGDNPLSRHGGLIQSILASLPIVPFKELGRILLLKHAQGIMEPASYIFLIPIFFLALAGLLVGYTEFGGRVANVGMLAAWLILPVLLVFAVSLIAPMLPKQPPANEEADAQVRSIIWISPAFMMFLALGAQVMRRAYGKLGSWLSIGLILFVVLFWGYRWWEQSGRPINIQLGAAHEIQRSCRTVSVIADGTPGVKFDGQTTGRT